MPGASGPASQARPPTRTDAALRERTARVIPGGLWDRMRAQGLPPGYPQFFSRAQACRLWGADGRDCIAQCAPWANGCATVWRGSH